MSEDVLEFGSPARTESRFAGPRFATPAAVPPILAAASAAFFFGSLMYPWQTTRLIAGADYASLNNTDIVTYATNTGVGYAYVVGMMGLGAITATTILGRRRQRRPLMLAGVGLSTMLLVLLVSLIALGGRQIVATYIIGMPATATTQVEVGLYLALAAPVAAALGMVLSLSSRRRRLMPVEPSYEEEDDAISDLTVTPVR
ncbi:hypothetical protein HDA40_004498 [Hamadaea flava]|uniref:Uncharacterized protein n=1 Tax=Hamadaea flava TaxID=1742688 RepID=A0ABV8LED5_9ACTN|nr:hypothetical protein [Hamadaea flava]MCP2325991.1 hypothetical protein [Hamadaea flava]